MANFEKVTSWLWRKSLKAPQQEDAYYYNTTDSHIVVVRGNQKPKDSLEIIDPEGAMRAYGLRGRAKLTKHSQFMYDYLKTKGF